MGPELFVHGTGIRNGRMEHLNCSNKDGCMKCMVEWSKVWFNGMPGTPKSTWAEHKMSHDFSHCQNVRTTCTEDKLISLYWLLAFTNGKKLYCIGFQRHSWFSLITIGNHEHPQPACIPMSSGDFTLNDAPAQTSMYSRGILREITQLGARAARKY